MKAQKGRVDSVFFIMTELNRSLKLLVALDFRRGLASVEREGCLNLVLILLLSACMILEVLLALCLPHFPDSIEN